jgi:S-adenosylmethionine-dependent methyltransferase
MSEIVKSYYDDNSEYEWERLNKPYSKIEFCSTMYLIDKYFPKKGSIIDIGSGPGRYSIELLKKGYKVSLFELSQNELNIAKDKINALGLKAEAYICENALNLNLLENEKYDALLLMGPMYHVLDAEDRLAILKEAMRILKKDGIAIIAYLNSWGILKAGVTEFYEEFSDIANVYGYLGEQSFDEKQSFTEVYFTTPPKATQEVKESGFELLSYAGAESYLSGIQTEVIRLSKENRGIYDNFVKVAAETCEYPQYRDATEHLHLVVKKK